MSLWTLGIIGAASYAIWKKFAPSPDASGSSFTFVREGARFFEKQTAAVILNRLGSFGLVTNANTGFDAEAQGFQIVPLVAGGVNARFALDKAQAMGFDVLASLETANAIGTPVAQGLPADRPLFLIFAKPSARTRFAGLTAPNAVLLTAKGQ